MADEMAQAALEKAERFYVLNQRQDCSDGMVADEVVGPLLRVTKEAVQERDSVVGSYYTCRRVLNDAGIPCQFGKDGEPTTDAGMGRDLADCVKSLVGRLAVIDEMVASIRELISFANYGTKPGIAMSDPCIKPYEAIGRAETLIAKATGEGGQGR